MSKEQMAFTYQALKDGRFATGSDPGGSQLGQFNAGRWNTLYQQLLDLKIVKKPFDPKIAYTTQFLSGTGDSSAVEAPGSK